MFRNKKDVLSLNKFKLSKLIIFFPGGELSGKELSMGGSAREAKHRGELPGGEVPGHRVRGREGRKEGQEEKVREACGSIRTI